MEMDVILGHTMGMPFRFGQSIEYVSALLFDLVRKSTRGENGVNPMEREGLAQSCRDHDVHFRGMDRPSTHPPLPQREPCKPESIQPAHQVGKGGSHIHERAEDHVAADTGITIEMEMRAHVRPFPA